MTHGSGYKVVISVSLFHYHNGMPVLMAFQPEAMAQGERYDLRYSSLQTIAHISQSIYGDRFADENL